MSWVMPSAAYFLRWIPWQMCHDGLSVLEVWSRVFINWEPLPFHKGCFSGPFCPIKLKWWRCLPPISVHTGKKHFRFFLPWCCNLPLTWILFGTKLKMAGNVCLRLHIAMPGVWRCGENRTHLHDLLFWYPKWSFTFARCVSLFARGASLTRGKGMICLIFSQVTEKQIRDKPYRWFCVETPGSLMGQETRDLEEIERIGLMPTKSGGRLWFACVF